MEVSILSICFCLFMMSIIIGILIVYIIDKKLSNVVVKIPRLEPIVIKTENNDEKKFEIKVKEKKDENQLPLPLNFRERLKPANSMENNQFHTL